MEPDTHLATAPKSSLIVKLRHQPLCARCTDMLPKWCGPVPSWKNWCWTIDDLTQSSSTCHCCRFLVRVLRASPWIQVEHYRRITIDIIKVGSQHMANTSGHWMSKTYYRPQLSAGRFAPAPRYSSFILPFSRVHDVTSDEPDSQMFCGRSVNAMVDLSLILSWYKLCTSRHEDSADGHGCCPKAHESLQDFRVIDVQRRCVVRTSGKVDYAALSYVWGNAKRLVLSKDNEAWLTTPGALAQTEENVPETFRDALEVAAFLGIANLWVDAICIDQSDPEQVKHHMDAMHNIYGSAVLTIVATAGNVDLGLPGISLPRGPPQAVFQYNGIRYSSAKRTFAAALKDCPWERRAWCLQEKLFSARLLVFTDSQVFYHCAAATWFEDTIMETSESNPSVVHLEERTTSDEGRKTTDFQHDTTYSNRYTALKEKNFWLLVQNYSQRELTFEADVIRAFGGILRSVEAEYGCALWGIPQYLLSKGLSWYPDVPRTSRREGFPSWSWAECRNSNQHIYFPDCKRNKTNIGVIDGQFRVAQGKHNGRYIWDLHWHYYAKDEHSGVMQLRAVQLERPNHNGAPHASPPAITAVSCTGPELSRRAKRRRKRFREWGLPSHPGSTKSIDESMPPLAPGSEMPPLSHVIRSYTSVATVLVHPDGDDYYGFSRCRLLVPGTKIEIARLSLDSHWSGIGRTHSLVYISRFCSFDDKYQELSDHHSEKLHLLLVESVPGWGEVKRRVQLVQRVSILDWRKANPRWELVSLA